MVSKYRNVEIWSADWHVTTVVGSRKTDNGLVKVKFTTIIRNQVTKYIPLRFLLLESRINKKIKEVKGKEPEIEIKYIKKIGETSGREVDKLSD